MWKKMVSMSVFKIKQCANYHPKLLTLLHFLKKLPHSYTHPK